MEIRFRENTGIKTAQNRNCDYFVLTGIGVDLLTGMAYCNIDFYEHLETATKGLEANAGRSLEWKVVSATDITSGMSKVLEFENFTTTALDTISLNSSVIV